MRIKAVMPAVLLAVAFMALHGGSAHAQSTTNTNASAPAPNNVEVKPGDTLSAIAAAYQTTYVRLYDANAGIQDPNVIFPGEKVRVPNANEQLPDRPLPSDAPAPAPVAAPEPAAPAATPAAEEQPAPAPAQVQSVSYSAPASGSVWDRLAQCESGGNWSISTGNGFYGGLQFTTSSWAAVGGSGLPSNASREEQIARAQILQSRQGWGAWPACSAKLGL
jgi:LysM repeat protein